jgi:hypothetical protein
MNVDFDPIDFGKLDLPTYDEAACSPAEPGPDWSGVVIVAPRRIVLGVGEQPSLPICGYYLVPVLKAMDGDPLALEITHTDSGHVLRARIEEPARNEFEVPPPYDVPALDRDELVGVSTGGYFNIDAQQYLRQPLEPGRLDVVVTYAGSRSNPVRVELVGWGPAEAGN